MENCFPRLPPILESCGRPSSLSSEFVEPRVSGRSVGKSRGGPFHSKGDLAARQARLLVGNTCPEGQWTVFAEAFDDSGMSGTTSPTHRRSGRAFHRMRVEAQGRGHNGKKFKEACETVVVNAHGGLLMLKHEIDNGEMIVLTNPETLEDQECRVVYKGEPGEKGQRIGVEFLTPAPRFWGLEFSELSTPGGGGDGNATAVH
jgi:hypothetical protein